jgi:hypothetical protein
LIFEWFQLPTDQLSAGTPFYSGWVDGSEYQVCAKDWALAISLYIYIDVYLAAIQLASYHQHLSQVQKRSYTNWWNEPPSKIDTSACTYRFSV